MRMPGFGRLLQPDVRQQPAVGRVVMLELPPMRCTAFSTIARPEAGAGGRGARGVAAEERRRQLRRASPGATPGPWSRTLMITHGPVRA